MSKNNLRGDNISPACDRSGSNCDLGNGVEKLLISKTKPGTPNSKTVKAKRIRFYHNGNKFFTGVVIPVASDRYRSFDSLTTELTKILTKNVTLPNGVRHIYSLEGKKISSIDELEDRNDYVCAGKGELFKKIDYSSKTDTLRKKTSSPKYITQNSSTPKSIPNCIYPRIITIIRNGIKPRKVCRMLLNKRNSTNMEQVLRALTEVAHLDSGAVRKVYNLSGQPVTELAHFFSSDDIFFVCGNERCGTDTFELENEEKKAIQQYKKTSVLRNSAGPKPKMPNKQVNRTYQSEQILSAGQEDGLILPPNFKNKFKIGKMIGEGNFAVVRLCKNLSNNTEYALKIIDKSKCKGKEDMIDNEVMILRRLNHPNIMSLIADEETGDLLFLICEYIPGGDLFDAIAIAQKFSEEQSSLMIKHLLCALAYLHNMDIVHRDVKPENLLVEYDGTQIKTLKLADFGLACEVTKPLYTVCGTPTYVAPEILAEYGYGFKIDVWAAGVILYILLCGYPPFVSEDNDQEQLFDCILTGKYDFPEENWSHISTDAKELIQNMLQLTPELRFSAEDVLDHPWLHTEF